MPTATCGMAVTMCMFGAAPMPYMVLPVNNVIWVAMPASTIKDIMPIANFTPFVMCTTPSNPMVAAATAAALGVLTPMPCIPMTMAPWVPPVATVTVNNIPAVSQTCKALCMWGGMIQQTFSGQPLVQLPM